MDKKEILELIDNGFNPEILALEFNVPIEKINKYLEQEKQKQVRKTVQTSKAPRRLIKKQNQMDILRENYFKIYNPSVESNSQTHPNTPQTSRTR